MAKETPERRMLSLADIMNAPDHKTIEVDVPEWGGTVRVRTLSIGEREAWEQQSKEALDKGQLYAGFVALCMVDADDKRIVPEDQIEFFARKAAGPMKLVFDAAQKLNGLGLGAQEQAKNA